ncbi:MAG TPA: D-alanyl-D-alanine carboxypeptidase family protein [Thermoleophilaceae bacterium]|nr:D-alanyl-D-alanine carboxypeptidase family protein [Thermoleophilaceae bacterium]
MRISAGLLLLATLALAGPAAAAERPPPVPGADAAIVVDGRDGDVMFAKDAAKRQSIASTTKLMTALLTLEGARPREVFTAADYVAAPVESQIGLRPGERMTVRDLFVALLLESANDAAATLAEGVSGSVDAFVADMNERAAELGLEQTSYENPIGFDDPLNYSTAGDLATLTRELLRRPRFARVVDMPEARLESGARPRTIDNRNALVITDPFVTGVKTGHTLGAGYVLVGSARGRAGARVISVVMGEPSEAARDADTLKLLRWGIGRFRRVRVLDDRRTMARADIEYRDERAVLVPARDAVLTLRDGERVRRRISAPEALEGPLEAGERVGSVTVFVDGERVRRTALVTASDVPGAGTVRVLTSVLGVPLTVLLVLAILLGAALAAITLRARVRLVRR